MPKAENKSNTVIADSKPESTTRGSVLLKPLVFWEERPGKGKNQYQIHILKNRLIDFLELNGFAKIYIGNVVQFVRVQDKIFEHTYIERIQDFVMEYIESLPVQLEHCDSVTRPDLENELLSQVRFVFSEAFLRCMRVAEFKENRDTRHKGYVYYKNGFVVIEKDSVRLEPYSRLKGNIWREQIIDRDFVYSDLFAEGASTDCDFSKFLYAISGTNSQRYDSLCTIVGYLMHGFKDPTNPQCVILCDEVLSENPEGGTGKGLLIKGIEQIKRVVKIDGKSFKFEKSFVWQRVNLDTQILCFDDVVKRFEFERLFSLITEGINVEKKNQGEFFIPFTTSPKIVVSTNYVIEGIGNSFERRKIEFELAPTFHSAFTPQQMLGRMMFVEWDTEEWQMFDNFCVHLIGLYLANGVIIHKKINLEQKKLIQMTNEDFMDYIAKVPKNVVHTRKSIFEGFHIRYPGNEKFVTPKRFFGWVRIWAKIENVEIADGWTNTERVITIGAPCNTSYVDTPHSNIFQSNKCIV